MKIALAQMKISEFVEDNLRNTCAAIADAAGKGANIILLPEGHLLPYFPQYPNQNKDSLAIPISHAFVTTMQEQCKKHKIVCVPSFYLNEGNRRYSAAIVVDTDGSIKGIIKKSHIVRGHLFYEADYFSPGEGPLKVVQTSIGCIGVVLCFDRHFPESFRSCARQGAELVLVPTANIFGEPLEFFDWELRVPARQNMLPIAMCNRVGKEGEMDFCGSSIIVGYDGEIVAKAGAQEEMIIVDLATSELPAARKNHSTFSLFRPEAYVN